MINSFADLCWRRQIGSCCASVCGVRRGPQRRNLGRSPAACGKRRRGLGDVTNCAFYLIRLLASPSLGNVACCAKGGKIPKKKQKKGCIIPESFITRCRYVLSFFLFFFLLCVVPGKLFSLKTLVIFFIIFLKAVVMQ